MTSSVVAFSLAKTAQKLSDVHWFTDPACRVAATLYTDGTGATAESDNVNQADASGNISAFLRPGVYWVRLTSGAVVEVVALPGVPPAPTFTSATAGSTKVDLVFAAPASAGGSPVTGIEVWRGTATGAETTLVTTVAATATTYSDTGRVAGTPLFYKLKAVNAVGSGAFSAERTATPTA